MHRTSVLHDPTGWRRRFVNAGVCILAAGAIALAIMGYRSFANSPHLEPEKFPWQTPRAISIAPAPAITARLPSSLNASMSRALPDQAAKVPRIAFFDVQGFQAFNSLQ